MGNSIFTPSIRRGSGGMFLKLHENSQNLLHQNYSQKGLKNHLVPAHVLSHWGAGALARPRKFTKKKAAIELIGKEIIPHFKG